MMRRSDITQWGVEHPWQNENQIEQDLLLSMAMVEIANDPLLGSELVLRGGTAFHKLFLPELHYCGDNGAMIGCQGYYEFLAGHTAGAELNAYATRDISLG